MASVLYLFTWSYDNPNPTGKNITHQGFLFQGLLCLSNGDDRIDDVHAPLDMQTKYAYFSKSYDETSESHLLSCARVSFSSEYTCRQMAGAYRFLWAIKLSSQVFTGATLNVRNCSPPEIVWKFEKKWKFSKPTLCVCKTMKKVFWFFYSMLCSSLHIMHIHWW